MKSFIILIIVLSVFIAVQFIGRSGNKTAHLIDEQNMTDRASKDTEFEMIKNITNQIHELNSNIEALKTSKNKMELTHQNLLLDLEDHQEMINKQIESLQHKIEDQETIHLRALQSGDLIDKDEKIISVIEDLSYQPPVKEKHKNAVTNYITIPENATLTGVKLMTSLIGRIPIKGKIVDPYPFKAIVGSNNLLANQLELPDIKGMIASGYAEGDLTLSCVRGFIHSLTFIFHDGTIQVNTSNNHAGKMMDKYQSLGWISDPYGNPCIAGHLHSNAPQMILKELGLGAAQGLARGLASKEQSMIYNPFDHSHAFNQFLQKDILADSVLGGSLALEEWWRDRAGDSFDAVYFESGKEIAINITKSIAIDYDKKGRKVIHVHHEK